jgi:hypothetical protein
MESWSNLFDPYNREARLAPAALLLAPVLLFVFVAYPEMVVGEFPKNAVVALLLLAAGYLFAGIARSAGKRVEEQLFRQWNGPPTTAMLRHRDRMLDAMTKGRYHVRLAEICNDFTWPSIEDERSDPAGTDLKYASATTALRARRRGDEHVNVLRENAQYGFRRNMFGLRTAAIIVAVAAASCAAVLMVQQTVHEKSVEAVFTKLVADPRYAALLAANVGIAIVWAMLIRQSWVRESAYNYARALLNTLDLSSSPLQE